MEANLSPRRAGNSLQGNANQKARDNPETEEEEMIHIYTAPFQPAIKFVVEHVTDGEADYRPFINPGNRLIYTICCRKRRPAKNLRVQVFYDDVRYSCSPGKGCKDPKVIAAKQKLEFQNRSKGQKGRRRTV